MAPPTEARIPFETAPAGSIGKVRKIIDEEGTLRLEELRDQVDTNKEDIYLAVMALAEESEVAVFPVQESVQIRSES